MSPVDYLIPIAVIVFFIVCVGMLTDSGGKNQVKHVRDEYNK